MSTFKDKVVVVTGAGGIICSVIAKDFARKGAKVALLDLNLDAATKASDDINKEFPSSSKAFKCNVLDKDDIKRAHDEVLASLGKCDILVNGAGGNNPKANTDVEFHELNLDPSKRTFFDLDKAGIQFVFDLNIMGSLMPTQEFAKDMVGRKGCNIINISSMNSYRPLTKIPAYSGAKSALSNFTQWLAVYFSKVNIRVNAIAPGFLVTNQNRDLLFDKDGNPTERSKKILRNTPLERFGDAEEMLGAISFLADEKAASFVTGIIIPIDGGFSAYSGV